MSRVNSETSIEVNGMPRHVADLRHVIPKSKLVTTDTVVEAKDESPRARGGSSDDDDEISDPSLVPES